MTGENPGAAVLRLVETVVDQGSWRGWDDPVEVTTRDEAYRADLARARARTGLDESVVTGEGRLDGRRVAVVACEFGFLGGSIGVAAGERLVRAVERATAQRLPLLAAPASGGTRMQEGTVAFLQMVKVAAAITEHKSAGLPYLVYLRHPTTGGVFASWGSLGHVTAAEPGALIGFLGPRVHQALYGSTFPAGVQVAENLMAHGLVDAVLPVGDLAPVAARALRVLCGDGVGDGVCGATGGAGAVASAVPAPYAAPAAASGSPAASPASGASSAAAAATAPAAAAVGPGVEAAALAAPTYGDGGPTTEESIRRSRRPERPGVRDLLRYAAEDVTPLSGTGAGEQDPGLLLALARLGGTPCVVLGHDRKSGAPRTAGPGERTGQDGPAAVQNGAEAADPGGGAEGPGVGAEGLGDGQPLGPAGLRTARRGMKIAAELGLPLLTVVDTAGAALSQEAEEGGLAGEIARCLADMVTLPAPTLCLLLGQGAGGAALALLPADRVVAARHAWLSPLPPEGASAILYRTTERAYEVADRQGVRSADLLAHGIVDLVVEETPETAEETPGMAEAMEETGAAGAGGDQHRGQRDADRDGYQDRVHRRGGEGGRPAARRPQHPDTDAAPGAAVRADAVRTDAGVRAGGEQAAGGRAAGERVAGERAEGERAAGERADGAPGVAGGTAAVAPGDGVDAGDRPAAFLHRLGRVLGAELAALRAQDQAERLAARRARHRRIGSPG